MTVDFIDLISPVLLFNRVEGSERGNNNNSYSPSLNNSQSLSRIMTSGNSHSHHSRTHGGQMSAPQQLHVYFSSQFMVSEYSTPYNIILKIKLGWPTNYPPNRNVFAKAFSSLWSNSRCCC